MRRERELKLLRKKRLIKKYSDFELSLLASEMNDYTYLLKSIKFPKEEITIIKKREDSENEEEEKKKELSSHKNQNNQVHYKKFFSFGNSDNNLKDINEKEESESEDYEGLKPKEEIKLLNKKRKN